MRSKLLIEFENFVYGNNFSVERILKLIAVLSAYAITLSFIYHQTYFSVLGINFQLYSELSDYIPAFFSKIYVLIILLVIFVLVQLGAANSDLKYAEELKQQGKYTKSKKIRKWFKVGNFVSLTIGVLFILIQNLRDLYENGWDILKTSILEVILLLVMGILTISIRKKIYNNKNFAILFFLIISISSVLIIGKIQGIKAKNNIVFSEKIEFSIEERIINIDNINSILVGETNKYFFIKHFDSNNIQVYDKGNIGKLTIKP